MPCASTPPASPTMLCAALLITSVLSACGGGGGDHADNAQSAGALPAAAAAAVVLPDQTISQNLASLGEAARAPATDESPAPRKTETVLHALADQATATQTPNTSPVTSPSTAPNTSPNTTPNTADFKPIETAMAAAAVPIDAADIAAQARTAMATNAQSWGNVQCSGYIVASQKLPANGIHGSRLADGRTLRFGRVSDPESATGHVFEIALNVDDPTTARSDRCELSFPASAAGGIPREAAFWHAFAVKLPDLSGTSDEQAIAQWHAGDTSGGLLPVYTLLLRGKMLRLVLRYDESATPARSTTRALVLWSSPAAPANEWITVVTQALVSTQAAHGPFVKTWLNGKQIVNYTGPVGYNQPTVHQYAKHGFYHWIDNGNPWDMALPTRVLRLKDPVLIRDPLFKYEQTTVKALVDGR